MMMSKKEMSEINKKTPHRYYIIPSRERPFRNIYHTGATCIKCGLNIGFDPYYGELYKKLKYLSDRKECWICKKPQRRN